MIPGIPQGTRDFGPETVLRRRFIFNTLQQIFEIFGFQPLETPAMEKLETLMGKYGDEGDKLIFKVLNNGLDRPEKRTQAALDFSNLILHGKSSIDITERALRYDLTIPFARYVAMNYKALTMPFKRYQMQPVWRADRPQKGRYREFYQCDADLVGSTSILYDKEFVYLYAQAFSALKIPVTIKINNRKILSCLANACGTPDQLIDITTAIDKLDKIGLVKVKEELSTRGISEQAIGIIEQYLAIDGNVWEKMRQLKSILLPDAATEEALSEIHFIFDELNISAYPQVKVALDLTLARGLNYYTGTIYEVSAEGVAIGSIGGGGRYNDLTGLFGVPNVPGVGISFGVDRIYDVMDALNLFEIPFQTASKLLFFNTGSNESKLAFQYMHAKRLQGVSCELVAEPQKFAKQFAYAEKKRIPFVAILGTEEIETQTIKIKELATGEENMLAMDYFIETWGIN